MRSLLLTLALFAATAPVRAADPSPQQLANWHQWRGPLATGVAPQADPPTHWNGEEGIRWKAPLPGRGSGTPIIWQDQMFLLTAIKTDKLDPSVPAPEDQPNRPFGIKFPQHLYRFDVLCLDRQTGKVNWQQTAVEQLPHEGIHHDNTYASSSPMTDGQRLFVSFGSRGVFCFDLTGQKLWERDLGDMQTRKSFGEATSPVVHGERVIVNWDHEGDSQIFCLSAANGETLWQRPRDEPSTWATPLVVEAAGHTQVIVNASNRVRSYDIETGEVIWECGGQVGNVTPCPVSDGKYVYCTSGYTGNAMYAIPLDATGDITDTDKVAWFQRKHAPYVPSPLLYGDELYFNKSNSALLFAIDVTSGKWLNEGTRLSGLANMYASPVGAADRIYVVGRDGNTAVLERGPELRVLTVNQLGERVDASPAIAGKHLYLRGEQHLYSIGP